MTLNPTVLAGTWTVDATATTAAFQAVGLGGSKVRGTIPVDAARIEVGGTGRPLSVDAVLDATRLATGNPRRDKDLHSKRFLKTETHPVIRFASHTVTPTATGWSVAGTLTAAGTECPLTLAVELVGTASDTACQVRATAAVDRKALGIKVPSFMIRREVTLEIEATLNRA